MAIFAYLITSESLGFSSFPLAVTNMKHLGRKPNIGSPAGGEGSSSENDDAIDFLNDDDDVDDELREDDILDIDANTPSGRMENKQTSSDGSNLNTELDANNTVNEEIDDGGSVSLNNSTDEDVDINSKDEKNDGVNDDNTKHEGGESIEGASNVDFQRSPT